MHGDGLFDGTYEFLANQGISSKKGSVQLLMDGTDAQALLSQAGTRGNAAVVILKCGEGKYAFQRKTPGYPIASQVGGLCLFGGNKETCDASARDTVIRELHEELPTAWANKVCASLKAFGVYVICADELVMKDRPTYSFVCVVFYGTLLPCPSASDDIVMEGELCVHSVDELSNEPFSWGYDLPFKEYLQEIENIDGKAVARHVPEIKRIPTCSVYRLRPGAQLGVYDQSLYDVNAEHSLQDVSE